MRLPCKGARTLACFSTIFNLYCAWRPFISKYNNYNRRNYCVLSADRRRYLYILTMLSVYNNNMYNNYLNHSKLLYYWQLIRLSRACHHVRRHSKLLVPPVMDIIITKCIDPRLWNCRENAQVYLLYTFYLSFIRFLVRVYSPRKRIEIRRTKKKKSNQIPISNGRITLLFWSIINFDTTRTTTYYTAICIYLIRAPYIAALEKNKINQLSIEYSRMVWREVEGEKNEIKTIGFLKLSGETNSGGSENVVVDNEIIRVGRAGGYAWVRIFWFIKGVYCVRVYARARELPRTEFPTGFIWWRRFFL